MSFNTSFNASGLERAATLSPLLNMGITSSAARAALAARTALIALPTPLSASLNAAPIAIADSDGIGTPPMTTLGLADTVVPIIGPSGGSLGLGVVKTQCLVMSTPMR